MKHVRYVLTPERGFLDPCEAVLRDYDVVPRYLRDVEVLDDGSVVLLLEADGCREGIDDSLAGRGDTVIAYEVAERQGTCLLHVHYHACDLVDELLAIHRAHTTLIDFPMEYLSAEVTRLQHDLFGPKREIRDLVAETRREIDVTVERVGSYEPVTDSRLANLTDRQREVLLAAVRMGYYEDPRQTTYEELADRLECSASAVGKTLRRIESELIPRSIGGGERSPGARAR